VSDRMYSGSASGLGARTADLSRSKPPRWAWQDRVVLAALNLIVGNEGAGKGTLAAWILAQLTLGELPGDLHGKPTSVGVIGDEDSWADVWTPRLHAAGANLDRVKLIERNDGAPIDLAGSKSQLARLVSEGGMALLYVDNLLDNIGADTDDWRAKQVRGALAPARQLARELQCAVLGSLHPNKSTAGGFRRLVSGSVAFNALSRSSLLLAAHPENPDRRVLVRGKGNLSATPPAVEFTIESHRFSANDHEFNVPRATDFTTSSLTADDLLDTPATTAPAGERRTAARELIVKELADGNWHDAGLVIAECERAGIYAKAAQRAAADLGVEKIKRGFPATSHWRLTGHPAMPVSTVPSVVSVSSTDSALRGRGDSKDSKDREDRGDSVQTRNGSVLSALDEQAIQAEHDPSIVTAWARSPLCGVVTQEVSR
jgi:hypothetical protein